MQSNLRSFFEKLRLGLRRGAAPYGAPTCAPPGESPPAPVRASKSVPSSAKIPLEASGPPLRAAHSNAAKTAPLSTPRRATRNASDRSCEAVPTPLEGGVALPELVLLPLFPYSEREMREVVSTAAALCERHQRPLIRVRSSSDDVGPAAAVHAFLLCQWWKARGWDADIPAHDLKKIYLEFCKQRNIVAQPWRRVATYVAYFTGSQRRRYCRVAGMNVRVYPPPPKNWRRKK